MLSLLIFFYQMLYCAPGPCEGHLFLDDAIWPNWQGSLSHPYAQGPKGENVGSITQPLPSNYLIFRAASESDGKV